MHDKLYTTFKVINMQKQLYTMVRIIFGGLVQNIILFTIKSAKQYSFIAWLGNCRHNCVFILGFFFKQPVNKVFKYSKRY